MAVGAAQHRPVHAGRRRPVPLPGVHFGERHLRRNRESRIVMGAEHKSGVPKPMTGEPVLSVRNLVIEVPTLNGATRLVDNVSFDVMPNEVLGIVGESGSGKSLTMLAVMGLLPP